MRDCIGSGMATVLLFLGLMPLEVAHAQWSVRTAGGTEVLVYVPPGDGPRGLLVALHGCAQGNADLRDGGGFEPSADAYDVVVALPSKYGQCWAYFAGGHSRDAGDAGTVVMATEELLNDPQLQIDRARVYVTGISSGGGISMVAGCLAPDLYAGMGLDAAPAIGHTPEGTTQACQSLAGEHAERFATQLAVVVNGTADGVVAPSNAVTNAAALAQLYGADPPQEMPVEQLPGPNPQGSWQVWSQNGHPRISLVLIEGLGHAWPSGDGAIGAQAFVDHASAVSFPAHLIEFLEENNLRVGDAPPPRDDAGQPQSRRDASVSPPEEHRRDASVSPPEEHRRDASVSPPEEHRPLYFEVSAHSPSAGCLETLAVVQGDTIREVTFAVSGNEVRMSPTGNYRWTASLCELPEGCYAPVVRVVTDEETAIGWGPTVPVAGQGHAQPPNCGADPTVEPKGDAGTIPWRSTDAGPDGPWPPVTRQGTDGSVPHNDEPGIVRDSGCQIGRGHAGSTPWLPALLWVGLALATRRRLGRERPIQRPLQSHPAEHAGHPASMR